MRVQDHSKRETKCTCQVCRDWQADLSGYLVQHRSLNVSASPEPEVKPEPKCEMRRETVPVLMSGSPSLLQPCLGPGETDDQRGAS
ncbi:hypothetical protein E2C01_046203 [Portunus trituberculatus]|uniref:Uncharacterized protein n=1 Tax=Portunus trituberculatus TaxID=210409 RepID=A0A5B7G597_PORTR|nr:hypothetical protein [Portunus trituberculatus]